VLGPPEALPDVVAETGARHLIVAFSQASDRGLLPLLRRCEQLGVTVCLVPRLFEAMTARVAVAHVDVFPVVRLCPIDPKGWQFVVKHFVDRLVAALAIVVLSPIFLVVALATKLTLPGPVFFRQRRVGRDGCEFDMVKFRTMWGHPTLSGEADAAWLTTIVGDTEPKCGQPVDRRTAVGRILRRWSLDELPQLWNVACGHMSLVGPRPERPEYVRELGQTVYRYSDRHRVKSGITGLAQVRGLRGSTSIVDRVDWDNHYIQNWSLALDCKILLWTLGAVLKAPDEA
jgi:exopolysaccharide biosynthesis polyprenyl glycosylphosphotransferase